MNKPEKEILDRTYFRQLDIASYDERILLVHAIGRLRRISFKLRRLYVDDCNGNPKYDYKNHCQVWDEQRADKNQKTEERLEAEAQKIAKDFNLFVRLQSDPRGAPIKLALHPDDAYTVNSVGADTDILC
jgi:hypothetical protein